MFIIEMRKLRLKEVSTTSSWWSGVSNSRLQTLGPAWSMQAPAFLQVGAAPPPASGRCPGDMATNSTETPQKGCSPLRWWEGWSG